MATDTFIVDCPECKAKVAAQERGRAERRGIVPDVDEPYGERLLVGQCPRCSTLLAAVSHQVKFKGWWGAETNDWFEPIRVYPEPPKILSSLRIPRSVTISLTEADIALQGNASLAACVMFGRALEAVCRDATDSEVMLAEGIKQLRDKNIIDSRLFDWSEQLRAFRNVAGHPDMSAVSITREDAEDLQAFVYAIIEYIYDLTDRYNEFKERQERRAKAKAQSKALSALFGET